MTLSFEVHDGSQPRRFAPRAIAGILAAGLVVLALVALAQNGESAGVAPLTTEMQGRWRAGQHVPRGSFDHHTEDYKTLRCTGAVLTEGRVANLSVGRENSFRVPLAGRHELDRTCPDPVPWHPTEGAHCSFMLGEATGPRLPRSRVAHPDGRGCRESRPPCKCRERRGRTSCLQLV